MAKAVAAERLDPLSRGVLRGQPHAGIDSSLLKVCAGQFQVMIARPNQSWKLLDNASLCFYSTPSKKKAGTARRAAGFSRVSVDGDSP